MNQIHPDGTYRPQAGAPWTLAQAAKYLGVSPKTIERRLKSHDIKAIHIGRLIRLPDAEVQRLATHGLTTKGASRE